MRSIQDCECTLLRAGTMNSDGAFDVDRYAFDVTDRLRDETDPVVIFGELTKTMANFGFCSVIVS
ncbi:MAG: hypothetical protein ACRCVA_14180, partial [Phreatobacter sp.]